MMHWLVAAIIAALVPLCCLARESGGMYTPERLANVRRNVENHDWAKVMRDRAVNNAAPWVAKSDEELWKMVPGQDLPRCIDATMTYTKSGKVRPGCLVCGEKVFRFGNYPWIVDPAGKPWKTTCPSCKTVYPTNDFGKYYESAIDEHGLFDPAKGDRSLLFNAEHPDPADPLHKWGVDDGYGYIDADGNSHRFIAYFGWKYWQYVCGGVGVLAEAYVMTGDPLYAHKCAVLLDRIADVYPAMDWSKYAKMGWYHSDGGSKRGKIEGRIWETGVLTDFARNYDKIITGLADQPELYQFLAEMGRKYQLPTEKGSRELLMANIDENILRCGADAVRSQQIWGNEGMHQRAMAACAIALDTEPETSEWLDWIFAEKGGHVPAIIVGGIDRDGVGAEAAPGYALGWGANIGTLADMLAEYGKYEKHDIYRDFPQFAKTFTAGSRITILDYDTPSIGDTGATGDIGKVQSSPEFMVRGYRYLGDPQIALAAYRANGDSAAGLGRSIFDEDPDRISREVAQIAAQTGAASGLGPHHMSGYGFLTLEFGQRKTGTGLFMYYGRNGGHGHKDRLNIGLYGFGFDLTPDLGYPEFATSWPQRNEFTDPTISHNTVLVDQIPQSVNWVGHPRFFKVLPGFQCAEVESSDVYASTRDYRRTVAMIQVSDWLGYALDVFRVEGGADHMRGLHGPGVEVTTSGLKLTAQETGTLAGPDIAFGTTLPVGPKYGYSWLGRIEYDNLPPDNWTVDWKVQAGYRGATGAEDVHVRMWDFTPADDVVLADGEPPQNKAGNPRWLRYCLSHRAGEDLTSTFVSLLEPYQGEPIIDRAERLPLPGDPHSGPVALRVYLKSGAVDTLIYSPDGAAVTVDDTTFCQGRLAMVRTRDGAVETMALIAGTRLQYGDIILSAPDAGHTGKVVRFDKDTLDDARIWVDADLPTGETLAGQEIIIENDRARNACYTIERVERDGDLTLISLGRVSLVRGYVDANDYSKGFAYNFAEGASFVIPNHIYAERRGDRVLKVQTSTRMDVSVTQP